MTSASNEQTNYEIYAFRYGENTRRKRGQNFILEPQPTEHQQMDFYSWVLVGGGKAIVVDTGMHPGKASTHGHDFLFCPVEALKEVGVEPEAVSTVILTHMHYDHVGNLDGFPNAQFFMQAEEMAYVTGPYMEKPWFRRAYEPDEIAEAVHYLHEGRLHLHGRDKEIADGVSVHWVGGHCAGQEIVRVRTERGWVVLASDALHYYEELDRGIPFAVVFNASDMIAAHDRIRELADSDEHVVPAHDPEIKDIYPPASSELSGRIMRVDLAPRPREHA